jgi:hypothetical protein
VYPDWAHDHWVWLSNTEANQASELQLVRDYLARDVPVGAVDIDSEWETGDYKVFFSIYTFWSVTTPFHFLRQNPHTLTHNLSHFYTHSIAQEITISFGTLENIQMQLG